MKIPPFVTPSVSVPGHRPPVCTQEAWLPWSAEPCALVVSGGKETLVFMLKCCLKPAPSLWVIPQEKSTLGSLSNGNYGLVKTSGASVQLDASTLSGEVMPNP